MLMIQTRDQGPKMEEITVDAKQIERVQNALSAYSFSELPEELGELIICSTQRRIQILHGNQQKLVTVYSFGPPEIFGIKDLGALERAVRIWIEVRSLLNDPRHSTQGLLIKNS